MFRAFCVFRGCSHLEARHHPKWILTPATAQHGAKRERITLS